MRRADVVTFLITFLVVFAVYAATTAPDIGLVDSGELTTAAATLSIAHPTGYPLYTSLGHVWLMLSPVAPARGMILFSAFVASLGTAFLALLCAALLERLDWMKPRCRHVAAALLAIGIGLSPTAWTSVDFAEVYPLTWLIGALILYLSFLNERRADNSSPYIPLLVCYLWGLGFGNHLTILWFLPLIAYVALRFVWSSARRMYSLIWCAALFLLGTSINLYLPLRSLGGPVLDWSAPHTIPGLIRHLSAWQYRVWMFKGNWSVVFRKLGAYLSSVPLDIGWVLTALAVLGLIIALRQKKWWLVSTFGVWLLGNLYNVNYDIPDISTYFLVFYAPLFVVAVYGFGELLRYIVRNMEHAGKRTAVVLILALIVPFASIAASGSDGIQSANRFARTYALEIFKTLPPNALVLQGNWDIQSPYIYLHYIERVRPDLDILDINLLQRPWYIRQEQRNKPGIFTGVEPQIQSFIRDVAPFESGQPYDGRRIESSYVAMLDSIISKQVTKRPVYIRDTYQSGHGGVAEKMQMVPGGFFMRITRVPTDEPVIDADRILSAVDDRDVRVDYLLKNAAAAASYQGDFALRNNDSLKVAQALYVCRTLGGNMKEIQPFMQTAQRYLSNNRILSSHE